MGHPTRDHSYRYATQESKYQQPIIHNHSRPQPSSKDRERQDINTDTPKSRDRSSYIRDGGIYQPSQSPRIYIGKSETRAQSNRHAAPKNEKTYTIEESKTRPKRIEYSTRPRDASHSHPEIIESNPRLRPRYDNVVLPPKVSGAPQASTGGTKSSLSNHQTKSQPQTNRGNYGLRIEAGDKEPPRTPSPRQSRPEVVLHPAGPRPRSYSRRRPAPPPPPPTNQNNGPDQDQDQNRNGDRNPSAMAGRSGGSTSRRNRRGSYRQPEKHVHFVT